MILCRAISTFLRKESRVLAASGALCLPLLFSASASAERGGMYGPPPNQRENVQTPPSYTREIGIDQKLNAQIPLDLEFLDDTGATVTLAKYMDGRRPVILAPVYYECPSVCTLVLNGLTKVAKVLPMVAGRDYQVVALSFDPNETPDLAANKKRAYMSELKDPNADKAWHFLTGAEDNIRAVTEAIGFRYRWEERTGTYAHAAGVVFITPEGRVSRYLYGTDYRALDTRLALSEAGQGRIGGFAEQILLLCFQYNPDEGRYSTAVLNLVRFTGIVVLAGMALFIFFSVRREKTDLGRTPLAGQVARATIFSPALPAENPQDRPAPGDEKA